MSDFAYRQMMDAWDRDEAAEAERAAEDELASDPVGGPEIVADDYIYVPF